MARFINSKLIIIQVAILMSFFRGRVSEETFVSADFKHCELNHPIYRVSLDSICDDDGISDQNEDIFNREPGLRYRKIENIKAMIYVKHHYMVEGYGYKCTMRINQYVLERDFFLQDHVDVSTRYLPLTKYDCQKMVELDQCDGLIMNCENKNDCIYEEPRNSKDDPHWWSTTKPIQRICSYKKIIILAEKYDTKIFMDAQSKCTANEHECILKNSIVIWNQDIVRNCIFESVLYIDDLILNKRGNNRLFESKKHRFLFKVTNEVEIACDNIRFEKTIEGLYLVTINSFNGIKEALSNTYIKENVPSISHLQDNDIREFMLAEVDFDKKHMLQTISTAACSSLTNAIRSNINGQDTFLVINEFGQKDITLYINDGVPYIPVCTQVPKIEILNSTDKCYRDFPVKYYLGDREVSGFLRPFNILSQFSVIDDCKTNDRNLVIEKGGVILKRKSKNVIIEKLNLGSLTRLKIPLLHEGSLDELLKHHRLLTNVSSSLEHLEEMIAMKEQDNILYVRGNEHLKISGVAEVKNAAGFFKKAYNVLKKMVIKAFYFILGFVLVIGIALAIIFGIIKGLRHYCLNKPNIMSVRYRPASSEQVQIVSMPIQSQLN